MNKKQRFVFLSSIITILVTLATSMSCYAIDSGYLVNQTNGKYSYSTINETNKPQFSDDNNSNEFIDPLTGSLTLRQTDLVLPGRDGFDFALERYYNSAQATMHTPKAGIRVSTPSSPIYVLVQQYEWYVSAQIYDADLNQTYYEYYHYLDRSEAEKKKYELERLDFLEDYYNRFSINVTINLADSDLYFEMPYYYTSQLEKLNYQRYRNNLGTGWSFSFPSVQIVRNDMNSQIEEPLALYYHTGNGAVYTINYDNSLGKYVFSEALDETHEFWESSGTINGQTILYCYKDAEEKTYYFGLRGELLRIADRFGNNIDFTYVNDTVYSLRTTQIKTITDTVGRVLTFNYNITNVDYPKIEVTVTAPNETKTLTLAYNKEMYQTIDKNGTVIGKEPVLTSFVNTNGETTYYNTSKDADGIDDIATSYFTYNSKTFDSLYDYQKTYTYLLKMVQYPHSVSFYNYESIIRNLGTEGITQGFRVTSREDYELIKNALNETVLGNYKNNASYDWLDNPMDYTGYPYYNTTKIIPQYEVLSRVTYSNGNRTSFSYKNITDQSIYNPFIVLYNESTIANYGNSNEFTIQKQYRNFITKRKPEQIITTVSNSTGNYTTYTELQYYNTSDSKNGMLKSETLPMQKADYDDGYKRLYTYAIKYDYQYGAIRSKEWTKDIEDGYTYEDSVSYDSKKRPCETYGVANRNSFTYEYLTGTNKVTKKTTIKDNGNNDEKTEEIFTSATDYAFPSEIRKYYKDENGVEQYRVKTYTYDMFFGKPKTITDANGMITYEYDNLGRATKETFPVYETYDQLNTLKQYKAERTITYDNYILNDYDRKLISLGEYEELHYNAVSDNALVFVSQAYKYYDGFGNLVYTQATDKVNGTTQWVVNKYYYNSQNKLQNSVDALTNITAYEYDSLGRNTLVTDPYLNKQVTEYETNINSNGSKVKSYFKASDSNTNEYVVETTLDIYNRAIEKKSILNANYSIIGKYTYDLVGNLTSYTDPNKNLNSYNVTNKYTYDGKNRLQSIINAKNEVTVTGYDEKSNITSFSVGGQTAFTKKYDAQGRLIEDKDPLNKVESYKYDSTGRLERHIDRNDTYSFYDYDNMNHVSDVVSQNIDAVGFRNKNLTPYAANTTWDIKYQYSGGVLNGSVVGYINRSVSQTGKLLNNYSRYNYNSILGRYEYSGYVEDIYDALGREVTTKAGQIVGGSLYGKVTNKTYNKTRLEKVQVDGNETINTSDSVNAKYDYYPNGLLKSISYPPLANGKVLKSVYVYDTLGRLDTLTNTLDVDIISKYTYSDYDDNGNVKKITETTKNSLGGLVDKIINIGYDKLNRISWAETDSKTNTYSYDARGNRKTEHSNDINFDESGFSYLYDEINRLKRVDKTNESGVTTTTQNEYTADGVRYSKTVNTAKTYYVYDKQGRITTEINGSLAITANFIWGPDRTLAKILPNGTRYYYIYNGHGDVVQIVDTDGNIVNKYAYDIWGNITSKVEGIHNPFTYFGQMFDESTGLYYLRARYYDPKTGTFTQEDKHWNTSNMLYGDDPNNKIPSNEAIMQSSNLYAYSMNNSIRNIDPSGENVRGYGVGASVGAGGLYSGQYLYVWDDNGNFAIYAVNNVGGGLAFSLDGVWVSFPDMDNVSSMEGEGLSVGASIGSFGIQALFCGGYTGTLSSGSIGIPKLSNSGTWGWTSTILKFKIR